MDKMDTRWSKGPEMDKRDTRWSKGTRDSQKGQDMVKTDTYCQDMVNILKINKNSTQGKQHT